MPINFGYPLRMPITPTNPHSCQQIWRNLMVTIPYSCWLTQLILMVANKSSKPHSSKKIKILNFSFIYGRLSKHINNIASIHLSTFLHVINFHNDSHSVFTSQFLLLLKSSLVDYFFSIIIVISITH